MVRWRTPSVQHQRRLLFEGLDGHKPHRWPSHRLTDRFGVGRIVLVPLYIGLHILRRHQTHLMAQRRQLARPVMRRRTSFHADQARRQPGEEGEQLTTSKLPAHHDALGFVDAVHLKDVLGQVQPDRCNLLHGWLPKLVVSITTISAL
jgi:hypothetical protein